MIGPFSLKKNWFLPWPKASRFHVAAAVTLSVVVGTLTPANAERSATSHAVVRESTRIPELQTPAGLRARVDFWKDIFAKYGKDEIILHHREWPDIVFDVVDLRSANGDADPVTAERTRKREVQARVSEIKVAMEPLAKGELPSTPLQQQIIDRMSVLPGGAERFQHILKDELVRSQPGIRERWVEAVERSGRYLPIMEDIFVNQFGLPREITRLPFVESSFDYSANSSVGAAGIWQFMPRTARGFMTVNRFVDERRDPIKSTEAAARFLTDAYRRLGSWPLAITSYNHGVGGVLQKVRRFGTTNIVQLIETPNERPFGFASENFFPSFLAALECYDERQKLFPEAQVEPPLRLASARLPAAVSVNHVLRQLGIDEAALRRGNYALTEIIWSGRSKIPAGYVLRVPEEFAPRLPSLRVPEIAALPPVSPGSSAVYGGATYRVRKGDTLQKIAKHYGVTVAQIQNLNGLTSNSVRVGDNLVVKPLSTGKAEAAGKAESTRKAEPKAKNVDSAAISKPPSERIIHQVRAGETLAFLARKYGTTVESLRALNNLPAARVRVGQTLIILRDVTSDASNHSVVPAQAPQTVDASAKAKKKSISRKKKRKSR